ncbi:probable Integral membrane protein SED5 [Zygosaccharomyces bailii ISA1307]|nr:probable Integral membrane protein SED5 [Zygosaccharomyces bailii ISA1307]
MNIRDRSAEFQQSVLVHKKRNKANLRKQEHARQLEQERNERQKKPQSSEFQTKASRIAHEISSTAQLLSKLAILAKRKPMFNDSPVEIAELSFLIKRKIYAIEQSLVDLSRFQRSGQDGVATDTANNSQHSKNVVNMLNTKMKNISGDFKGVLEERQRLEMNNRDRWEKISQVDGKEQQQTKHTDSVATYNSSNPFMSSVISETSEQHSNGGGNSLSLPQESQMMLMEEGQMSNGQYLQERNRAVETIESTIQEVGNLFQQLASMVQGQGDVIQRIDANVDDIDMNISGAQRELLKYFDRVKSNRWLAVKIFFIIFAFFLVWVLVN